MHHPYEGGQILGGCSGEGSCGAFSDAFSFSGVVDSWMASISWEAFVNLLMLWNTTTSAST